MNRTTTRLALRLHRFEIVILAALAVLGALLALLVCSWLDGTGYTACARAMQTGAEPTPACISAQDAFYKIQSGSVVILTQVLLFAVPYLLAVLTGVAIVGREVERGTARLAWSLAPSRATWFAGRLLPLLAVVAAVGLLTGLAGDRLSASMIPGTNPWASLADFGSRGVDQAARVVFAFAVAVLVGAALGRALPALLVGTIVIFLGLGGGSGVDGRILASEAVLGDQLLRPGQSHVRHRVPGARWPVHLLRRDAPAVPAADRPQRAVEPALPGGAADRPGHALSVRRGARGGGAARWRARRADARVRACASGEAGLSWRGSVTRCAGAPRPPQRSRGTVGRPLLRPPARRSSAAAIRTAPQGRGGRASSSIQPSVDHR